MRRSALEPGVEAEVVRSGEEPDGHLGAHLDVERLLEVLPEDDLDHVVLRGSWRSSLDQDGVEEG